MSHFMEIYIKTWDSRAKQKQSPLRRRAEVPDVTTPPHSKTWVDMGAGFPVDSAKVFKRWRLH